MILGVAAALYVLLHGLILGISGIVSGLLRHKADDRAWRIALIGGLLSAPILAALFFGVRPVIDVQVDEFAIMVAGLLVGFCAQYGSGCTGGHGICGLSRLSPRSLVATLAFMSTGFLTVYVFRHLIGG
ncbi:YeeE/YedE family protein [Polynucleobacter necessarius]|uniref:YeeE/YedE family protein n=1 Tax=Polynucleobacter necessarius TaxID=576610 RepID=UPI000E098E08